MKRPWSDVFMTMILSDISRQNVAKKESYIGRINILPVKSSNPMYNFITMFIHEACSKSHGLGLVLNIGDDLEIPP